MVVRELLADPDHAALTATERETVFLAALLHDVAKCSTTVVGEDGRIGQPGHSRRGRWMRGSCSGKPARPWTSAKPSAG